MNLLEIGKALEEREATLVLARSHQEWCVWLYAGDDPAAAFFVEVDKDLEKAVASVFAAWDGSAAAEEAAEKIPKVAPSGTVEITDDD